MSVNIDADLNQHEFIVAVAGMIFNAEGHVLAMKRSSKKDAGAGLWETMSGRVDHGENPYDAIQREIFEETGLASGIDVVIDPRPYTTFHAKRLGQPMIVILYRAAHIANLPVLSEEHDEFAWLSPKDFAERSTLLETVKAVEQAADEHDTLLAYVASLNITNTKSNTKLNIGEVNTMKETNTRVGAVADFPEESMHSFVVEGQDVLLIHQQGKFYALEDKCTHDNGVLHDGELMDGWVKCERHGAKFNLETGAATLPAIKKVRLYKAEVSEGEVYINMQEASI